MSMPGDWSWTVVLTTPWGGEWLFGERWAAVTEGGEAQEAGGVGYGSDRAVDRALTVGLMSLVVLWTSLSATKKMGWNKSGNSAKFWEFSRFLRPDSVPDKLAVTDLEARISNQVSHLDSTHAFARHFILLFFYLFTPGAPQFLGEKDKGIREVLGGSITLW